MGSVSVYSVNKPQDIMSHNWIHWTAEDFKLGAARLVTVLRQNDTLECLEWSYDEGCLIARTTRHASSLFRNDEGVKCLATSSDNVHDEDALKVDESILDDCDAIVVDFGKRRDETEWSFSVVYSEVWRAPVLYFTVQRLDGIPCTRREVLDMLDHHDHQNAATVPDSWDFVSWDEHPVTGIPSFVLHPCRTLERLQLLGASFDHPTRRVWSWITMILPTVGVSVSPRTFQLVQRQLDHFIDKSM